MEEYGNVTRIFGQDNTIAKRNLQYGKAWYKMKQRRWKNMLLVFCMFVCVGIGVSQIDLKSVNTYQQEQKKLAEQMEIEQTENRKEAEPENQEMVNATSDSLLSSEKGGDKNQTSEKKKGKKEEISEKEEKSQLEKQTGNKNKKTKEKNSQKQTAKKTNSEKKKKDKKEEKKAKTTKTPSTEQENTVDFTSTPLMVQTEHANTLEEVNKEETPVPVVATEVPTNNPTTATKAPDSTEEPKTLTCEMEIDCTVLLDNMDKVEEGTKNYVPANGMILDKMEVKVEEGDTVYDVLSNVCKAYNIQLDAEYSKMYSTSYIRGIGYIYEKCAGTRSGWVYMVNGKSPNKGASQYQLSNGDVISWIYTCTGKAGS